MQREITQEFLDIYQIPTRFLDSFWSSKIYDQKFTLDNLRNVAPTKCKGSSWIFFWIRTAYHFVDRPLDVELGNEISYNLINLEGHENNLNWKSKSSLMSDAHQENGMTTRRFSVQLCICCMAICFSNFKKMQKITKIFYFNQSGLR